MSQIIWLFFVPPAVILAPKRYFCSGINKQNPPSSSYQWMFWRRVVEVYRSIVVPSTSNAVLFTLWISSSTWLLNVRKIFALKIIFLLQSTLHHLMHYVPNLLFYWFVIQRLIRCKISNIPTTTRQPGIYCWNRKVKLMKSTILWNQIYINIILVAIYISGSNMYGIFFSRHFQMVKNYRDIDVMWIVSFIEIPFNL